MCFAPQRRTLFRYRNFQKWSGAGVLCTFWLGHVLRATTACTFSTSQFPKVVRACGALYILTSKCASRHNGVQFFISHLARWLCTRRFSEPTFSRTCIFYSFSSLIFSLLLFSLLLSSSLWLFPSLLFICPFLDLTTLLVMPKMFSFVEVFLPSQIAGKNLASIFGICFAVGNMYRTVSPSSQIGVLRSLFQRL